MRCAAWIAGIVTFAVIAAPVGTVALAFLSIRSPTATGSAPGPAPAAYAIVLGIVGAAALFWAGLVAWIVNRRRR